MRFSILHVIFLSSSVCKYREDVNEVIVVFYQPHISPTNYTAFRPGVGNASSPDFLSYDDDHDEEKQAVVPLTLKRDDLKDPDYEIPPRLDTYDSILYS